MVTAKHLVVTMETVAAKGIEFSLAENGTWSHLMKLLVLWHKGPLCSRLHRLYVRATNQVFLVGVLAQFPTVQPW